MLEILVDFISILIIVIAILLVISFAISLCVMAGKWDEISEEEYQEYLKELELDINEEEE